MHRPLAAPFQGSSRTEEIGDDRFARRLDLLFGSISIFGACIVWVAIDHASMEPDKACLLTSLMLLVLSSAGLAAKHAADDIAKDNVRSIYNAVFRRLTQAGDLAVGNLPPQGSYAGVAGLIGDLVLQARKQLAARARDRQNATAFSEMFQATRDQAQYVASQIREEAGSLAAAAAEIDFAAEHLTRELADATQSMTMTEIGVDSAADRLIALAGSVRTVTASAAQMTSIAVEMSQIAHAAQQRIVESQEKTIALDSAMNGIEHALQTARALGHSITVEAAFSGPECQGFASIAGELQEVADGCRPALELANNIIRQLIAETGEANRRTMEISNLILTSREVGGAIGHAVQQQGEEIAHILRDIYESRQGFAILKAGIEAVTSSGKAKQEKAEALRSVASRLPSQAESVASLLRGLPDFAPLAEH